MNTFKVGNVVKTKTDERLMVISKIVIDKGAFNTNAINYVLGDDKPFHDVNIYECWIEQDSIPTKLTFKGEDLILVREK